MDCKKSEATWSIWDILVVSAVLFLADIAFMITWSYALDSGSKAFSIATNYFVSLTTMVVPVIWVKRRYGLEKSALGLAKGIWTNWAIIGVGIGAGCVYGLLSSLFINGAIVMPTLTESHVINMVTVPISIAGIPALILGPIAEEVYFRGFLYGYLAKKLGQFSGLILQAALFSALHLYLVKHFETRKIAAFLISIFVTGIVLGLLYRLSRSLYPSILFHGAFNYLAAIAVYGIR